MNEQGAYFFFHEKETRAWRIYTWCVRVQAPHARLWRCRKRATGMRGAPRERKIKGKKLMHVIKYTYICKWVSTLCRSPCACGIWLVSPGEPASLSVFVLAPAKYNGDASGRLYLSLAYSLFLYRWFSLFLALLYTVLREFSCISRGLESFESGPTSISISLLSRCALRLPLSKDTCAASNVTRTYIYAYIN